jgi:hypothetical protein
MNPSRDEYIDSYVNDLDDSQLQEYLRAFLQVQRYERDEIFVGLDDGIPFFMAVFPDFPEPEILVGSSDLERHILIRLPNIVNIPNIGLLQVSRNIEYLETYVIHTHGLITVLERLEFAYNIDFNNYTNLEVIDGILCDLDTQYPGVFEPVKIF